MLQIDEDGEESVRHPIDELCLSQHVSDQLKTTHPKAMQLRGSQLALQHLELQGMERKLRSLRDVKLCHVSMYSSRTRRLHD